ncbi:hypothetical protein [Aeromonas caviae]|jgi:hypothetical protein|uniref:hypothetical protein n=1 Tax=Aeromonas caviae TaxID=648 RepID=UPI00385EC9AA
MKKTQIAMMAIALLTGSIHAKDAAPVSNNQQQPALDSLIKDVVDYRAKYRSMIDSFLTKMDIDDRDYKILGADTTSPTDGSIIIDKLNALGYNWITPQATFGKDPAHPEQQKILNMMMVKTIKEGGTNMSKFHYEGLSSNIYKKYRITPIKGQDGCGGEDKNLACYRSFQHDDVLIEVSFNGEFLFLNMSTKF